MLDRKVVELTDGLIQTQFAERRKRLPEELRAAAEQHNARGILNSSIHLERALQICRSEIETRGWIVHNAHFRVLSQLSIEPYPELSQDLKGRLSYYLPLEDDYAQYPKELARQFGLQSHPDIRIHEAHEHVLGKIGIEINLFVETLARQKQQRGDQPEGKQVYNFYSGVGAFQTGPGSIANIRQHIGSQDKEAVQEALMAIKNTLSTLSEIQDIPKEEIIELVDDAHAEVGKHAPNRVKLSTTLTAIGETIRTVGSLNGAYQLLKTALLPLGITLP